MTSDNTAPGSSATTPSTTGASAHSPTPTELAAQSPAPPHSAEPGGERVDLRKYAWLSIAAALVTMALKVFAWLLTGSVGLLSDAMESSVNLIAAIVALIALTVAAKPATERFLYGRSKAEYFSAVVEGVMIFVAAAVILVTAAERFFNPQPLQKLGIGLIVMVIAAIVNGGVAIVLQRAGKAHGSITLTADGKHLMIDVWTSVGVLAGVFLVWLTGWERLDPVIAFVVGINIIVTGIGLIRDSVAGLLDRALDDEDHQVITEILRKRSGDQVQFHGLQTRESGQLKYMNVHVLVPDDWTVQQGHNYIHGLETELATALPTLEVFAHLEPIGDPTSYEDIPEASVPVYSGDQPLGEHPPTSIDPEPTGPERPATQG